MNVTKAFVWVDGGARGNPGPAAIGAVVKDEQEQLITSLSRRIGIGTNNQAEYMALIAALEKAISLGARQVHVKSDSELMVKQLNGNYRVKNANLKRLYQKVKQLQGSLQEFTITHIPRQQNQEADRLVNRALDMPR